MWPFCVVLGKPIIRELEAALSMTHVHTRLRILDPNPPCLSPLYGGGKLRPQEKQAPQVPQGTASTKPQVSGFLLHSSLASRLLLPKPCQLTLAKRETRIRKVTRESKTGARPFCVRLCRSCSFVGATALPPWDADLIHPSHLLGIYLRLSAGQMAMAWIAPGLATSLALFGAQKSEWGAGAYPQTSGRRPGWRQTEHHEQEYWWHGLASLLAGPGGSKCHV